MKYSARPRPQFREPHGFVFGGKQILRRDDQRIRLLSGDGRGIDFVTVTGQIPMAVHNRTPGNFCIIVIRRTSADRGLRSANAQASPSSYELLVHWPGRQHLRRISLWLAILCDDPVTQSR
jgi:hypothetical protein